MITKQIQNNIRNICDLGFNVAMLNIGNDIEFFTYSSFDPSQSTAALSTDYCTLRGMAVTEFIKIDRMDFNKKSTFNANFMSYIQEQSELQIRFNKFNNYILFSQ